jgi:subtilisin family serine protease
VTYVVAAGNDGWDFDYPPIPDTPAAYPEALTVTAVSDSDGKPGATGGAPACRTSEADDRHASFSNYALTAAGKEHTIAAPGVCIKSTWMNGGYNTISGTSMATPHMAGVVALCLGEVGGPSPAPCAGLSPAQIIPKMRTDAEGHTTAESGYGFTGDPLRPVGSRYYGFLTYVGTASVSPPPPPPPPPPTISNHSPTGYSPQIGTVYSGRGAVSRLASNDGSRVEITASNSGGTYVSEIQPSATISQSVLGSLRKLTVNFDGNVSSGSAALSVLIWNVAAGRWDTILAPRTGLTSDFAVTWSNSTSPKDYVDPATGRVRVRVRGTRSGSFRTRTDWVRFRTES